MISGTHVIDCRCCRTFSLAAVTFSTNKWHAFDPSREQAPYIHRPKLAFYSFNFLIGVFARLFAFKPLRPYLHSQVDIHQGLTLKQMSLTSLKYVFMFIKFPK